MVDLKLDPGIIIYKIMKQLSTLITTAFAIAAGYEWRIAIGKILKKNIEVEDGDIYTYPILVTIIAVCATIAIETLSLHFLYFPCASAFTISLLFLTFLYFLYFSLPLFTFVYFSFERITSNSWHNRSKKKKTFCFCFCNYNLYIHFLFF